jgi:hypothetical protein
MFNLVLRQAPSPELYHELCTLVIVNFDDFGDSVMPSFGEGISWDDSATLVALAKAFKMLGSWSSYKKTPVGTIA